MTHKIKNVIILVYFFKDDDMKAVIFDMDGVIVDSEAVHTKVKIQALHVYGIECSPEECIPYFGRSSRAFFSDFIKHSPQNIPLEKIEARKQELFVDYITGDSDISPVSGALELIKELHKRNVPIALASSAVRANIEIFLNKFNVYNDFNVILSGAELSESKPNPEIYLLAARRLGMKPQDCMVIEDAESGIIAAKRAGSYCVAYCNPSYKGHGQDVSLADMQVDSLRKISVEQILRM